VLWSAGPKAEDAVISSDPIGSVTMTTLMLVLLLLLRLWLFFLSLLELFD
jgi:hypothetical protein